MAIPEHHAVQLPGATFRTTMLVAIVFTGGLAVVLVPLWLIRRRRAKRGIAA